MAIEPDQFRIIPDPVQPGRWAYEILEHGRRYPTVGGFRSPTDAKSACDRARRTAKKAGG